MFRLLTYLSILFSINHSVRCSYRYVGCYTQVFHDSYFTSSFMEPTICFRLCDTPIIYIQGTVCRCSGGGLMHYNRKENARCTIPCTTPVNRSASTANTCGGTWTYSAYVQEDFYMKHGHLFDYQIQLPTCEQWLSSDVYETSQANTSVRFGNSSLSRLERCVAACLDLNATTRSIAFNGDSDNCLCIMPLKSEKVFDRTHYIKVLSNDSCDRHCNNSYDGQSHISTFTCGSTKDSNIWSVYQLNGTCPVNFVYMRDLKKCVFTYKNFWNSCTPPSVSFVFDGSITWKVLLQIINKLQLNDTSVTVEFDNSVTIDSSWKCNNSTEGSNNSWNSYFTRSRSTLYGWSSNLRYILRGGCLSEGSYSSYIHRYSNRLCICNAIDRFSLTSDDDSNSTYVFALNSQVKYCPTNWFDLNGQCYRVSDEPKTIEEAQKSCIKISTNTTNTNDQPRIWLMDNSGSIVHDDELNDSPKGNLVTYISEWQSRLGFFLLDTESDDGEGDSSTPTTSPGTNNGDRKSKTTTPVASFIPQPAINEFQVISSSNSTNSSNACMIITRSFPEENETPILRNRLSNDCNKPRHVLCETKTLITQKYQYGCFSKPNIPDIPALISHQLSHELCLSVCQELQTKLAILHINKCYCLNGISSGVLNITANLQDFRQKACGAICPGNAHEICGDENTIVLFQILDSRRTFTYARTPPERFPNYVYNSCIYLKSFNQSIIYKFRIPNKNEFHPRYCLAFCEKYSQKYALINDIDCLCTNAPVKSDTKTNDDNDDDNNGDDDEDDIDFDIIKGQSCAQQCAGNYFYTCGNQQNTSIYSLYVLQPKCRHGFEVAENDQQCVYSHFSSKTNSFASAKSFCQSLGGSIAKINDIVEIQDILPDSILHTRLMQQLLLFSRFRFSNDTRYYWIDRTDDKPDPNTISERLLKQCSDIPEKALNNCVVIKHVRNSNQNTKSNERCISASNDCATVSAMPVCVDKHIEQGPSTVPPITDDNPADVSVNVTDDHSCGDNDNYHLVDTYCYRIFYHELNWTAAQAECQRDNAILFFPEKSITLQFIKHLLLRRKTYVSSGLAHVGVMYSNINRTVFQYDAFYNNGQFSIPDSNAIYELCKKTYQDHYVALTSLSNSTVDKKNLNLQLSGCAYINLAPGMVPSIRCDEIPCVRTGTVICQKLPTAVTKVVQVKREYISKPIEESTTTATATSTVVTATTTVPISSTNSSLDDGDNSPNNTETDSRSIGRDFAPIFLIFTIIFILVSLALISSLYNHRMLVFRSSRRRNGDSVYSQLTTANEFDLN